MILFPQNVPKDIQHGILKIHAHERTVRYIRRWPISLLTFKATKFNEKQVCNCHEDFALSYHNSKPSR